MHYFSGKGCSESLESMHYCIGIFIGYGRGETGKFIVSKLSQNEVLEYNKSIAKYGNKLVIKDQNYDVKQLFVGISKRIT